MPDIGFPDMFNTFTLGVYVVGLPFAWGIIKDVINKHQYNEATAASALIPALIWPIFAVGYIVAAVVMAIVGIGVGGFELGKFSFASIGSMFTHIHVWDERNDPQSGKKFKRCSSCRALRVFMTTDDEWYAMESEGANETAFLALTRAVA